MKLNKLLLAASAVAMTASSASALDIIVNNPTAPVTPALELEFPQPAGNSVDLQFEVNTDIVTTTGMTTTTSDGGDFPAGNNLLVNITLPAGTSFSTLVTGDVVSSNDGTVSAVVQGTTGQAGQDSVSLLVSIPQGAMIDDLQFGVAEALNVTLDECPATASPLIVTVTTESGTPIQSGEVRSDSFVTECRSAVDVAVLDDNALFGDPAAQLDADTFIELPDYNSLSDDVVGFTNGTIDGSVSRDINGTPVDESDILNVSLNVVLEDTTGLDTISLNGETQTIVDGQLVYTFVFSDAGEIADFFDGNPDAIELTADNGADQIETQQLRVENIVTRFVDTNANFVRRESYNDGNIDFLQREGKQFGSFDWNSGSNGGATNSVYRITGLDQVEDTEYTITLDNARPASVEGTYRGTVPASLAAAQNGEATLTSLTKWGIPSIPDFIRADATINFESNAPIDVDRLLFRSGVISDFGGGANGDFLGLAFPGEQPTNDGDQFGPGGGDSTE